MPVELVDTEVVADWLPWRANRNDFAELGAWAVGDGEDAPERQERAVLGRPGRPSRSALRVLGARTRAPSSGDSAASTGRRPVPRTQSSTGSAPGSTCRYVVSHTSTRRPASSSSRRSRPACATASWWRSTPASGRPARATRPARASACATARRSCPAPGTRASRRRQRGGPARRAAPRCSGHPLQRRVADDDVDVGAASPSRATSPTAERNRRIAERAAPRRSSPARSRCPRPARRASARPAAR